MNSIRSSKTAYTRRSASVTRRDHTLPPIGFNGSGLPIPSYGSRITASIRSSTRSAAFRLVSGQYRKSSRHSSWSTALRLRFATSIFYAPIAHCHGECERRGLSAATFRCWRWNLESKCRPQFIQICRLRASLASALKGSKQPCGVGWRPQEIRRLPQAGQLVSRNERHILMPTTLNHRDIARILYGVQDFSQVLARMAVTDGN